MSEELDDRLWKALVEGSAAALADWAATGYPGLLRLRAHLAVPWDLAPIPADRAGLADRGGEGPTSDRSHPLPRAAAGRSNRAWRAT